MNGQEDPQSGSVLFFAPALAAGHPIDRTHSALHSPRAKSSFELWRGERGAHCCMTTSQKQDNMREQEHTSREPNSTHSHRGFTLGCARVLCLAARSLWDTLAASIHQGHPSSQVHGAGAIPDVSQLFFPFRLRIRRPHRKSHTTSKNSSATARLTKNKGADFATAAEEMKTKS